MTVMKNPYVYYIICNGLEVISQKPINRNASRAITQKRQVLRFRNWNIFCSFRRGEHFWMFSPLKFFTVFVLYSKNSFRWRPFWKWLTVAMRLWFYIEGHKFTVSNNPYVYYVISNRFQVISQKPFSQNALRAITWKRFVVQCSTLYIK